MLVFALGVATAQTTAQAESSIHYLRQRACIDATGPSPVYAPTTPAECRSDDDCSLPATCLHRSALEPVEDLYPPLALREPPTRLGAGEGVLRYVPLCEDGSGDHEYTVSGGSLGTPPTCAPARFIRCADGTRPSYRVAPGTENRWLVYVGGGGHAMSPSSGDEPPWVMANLSESASYRAPPDPALLGQFEGIFDGDPANPFSTWNRVQIAKCAPDQSLGNAGFPARVDYLTERVVDEILGACVDADGSGRADCADNATTPGACVCRSTRLAPPRGGRYAVWYHGRRMVRAVLGDLVDGAVAYQGYPLVDDGAGGVVLQPGDAALQLPDASSQIVFTCHSNGCNGLHGHIDDLHERVDALLGADVDVRAIFSSFFPPSYETESTISEWDGTDVDGNGLADATAVVDDTRSVYDHVVDTVSMTGEPMSLASWEPGGDVRVSKSEWYEPRQGYGPPIDASCLDFHCPGATDWDDPACTPCTSSLHVLFNHLQTPFVYNQGQRDLIDVSVQCIGPSGEPQVCDFDGRVSGVDLVDSHYRQAVRKQFADLYRYGETARCEAAAGPAPYDHLLLLSPDWESHASLASDDAAHRTLDVEGPVPAQELGLAAYWYLDQTSPAAPRKVLCLEERTAGENAATFGGTVPTCD
jgi:hypothetical protein